MRTRSLLVPSLALAGVLLAGCGSSGSSNSAGGSASGGSAASGAACAPVAGDKLVVLEDDKHLQLADNVTPVVNAATAATNPAVLPALDAVSAKLTTDELIKLNAAVDVDRKSAPDVASGWVRDNDLTQGLQQGSGPIVVGAAPVPETQRKPEVRNVPEGYQMIAPELMIVLGGIALVLVVLFGVLALRRRAQRHQGY